MRLLALPMTLTAFACASTPGAQPHDMSADHHEAAANEHDEMARAHATQYDPKASVEHSRCTAGRADDTGVGCWTSVGNPTAAHLDEADKHHKMAMDHRAASQALRDAEGKMCVGISDADRDMSPFEHREDIANVQALNLPVSTTSNPGPGARLTGAVVTFRAVPGMTTQWLQRLVDCHLARNAALGHMVPEMPSCPLVPNGASAHVTATDTGFAVAIASDDAATAREIWRRAQLLH